MPYPLGIPISSADPISVDVVVVTIVVVLLYPQQSIMVGGDQSSLDSSTFPIPFFDLFDLLDLLDLVDLLE